MENDNIFENMEKERKIQEKILNQFYLKIFKF